MDNCSFTDYSLLQQYGNISIPCNTVVDSANLFTGVIEYTQYGYTQNQGATQAFLVLFSVATAAHVGLGVWQRQWWTLGTLAAGAAVETLGWAGRLWSSKSETWLIDNGGEWYSNYNAYIMQVVCLVIAPTFFSAANYVLLGKLMRRIDGPYTSLRASSFATLFVCADVATLVVQAAGGGIAGTAGTTSGANTGAYIMTAGVCIQLLVTAIYIVFLAEFMWRFRHGRPARRQYDMLARCSLRRRRQLDTPLSETGVVLKDQATWTEGYDVGTVRARSGTHADAPVSGRMAWLMIGMMCATTFLIVVRSFYRAVELSNGWAGSVAVNQNLFIGMDASLMCILILAWLPGHPCFALGRRR